MYRHIDHANSVHNYVDYNHCYHSYTAYCYNYDSFDDYVYNYNNRLLIVFTLRIMAVLYDSRGKAIMFYRCGFFFFFFFFFSFKR